MKNFPDFWSVILGKGPHGFFFGYLVLGLIAAAAMMCIIAAGRDKDSDNTPKEWSWKFFWINNLYRIIGTFLLMYLFVRAVYEYANPTFMLFLSIGLGFGFPKLAHMAKKWGFLTTNKLSERISEVLKQKELEKNGGQP